MFDVFALLILLFDKGLDVLNFPRSSIFLWFYFIVKQCPLKSANLNQNVKNILLYVFDSEERRFYKFLLRFQVMSMQTYRIHSNNLLFKWICTQKFYPWLSWLVSQ